MQRKRLLLLLLLIAAVAAPLWATCPATGFSYYRTITTDNTKVPNTDQTDFPMLVSISDATFKTTGGHVISSTAADVLFYDSTCTTQIASEIEFYDSANGVVVAWVKIASLLTGSATVVTVSYGNSSPPSRTTNPWNSAFKGVWHLKDGTTISGVDSTGLHDLTVTGSLTAITTGQVDGAVTMPGTAGNYLAGVDSTDYNPSSITLSAWIKLTDNNIDQVMDRDIVTTRQFQFRVNAGKIEIIWFLSAVPRTLTGGTTVNGGSWKYVSATWDGTTSKIYVNGVSDATPTTPGGSLDSGTGAMLKVGKYGGTDTQMFNGSVDEIHFSSTARSADWLLTEFNNQNSPSTFYTLGAETAAATAAPIMIRIIVI